ncbi:MAG: hypothetical protein ABJB12_01360 [Pseudomonadota bacterium]
MDYLRLVPALTPPRPSLPEARLQELFADQGYLVLPGLVDPSVVEPLRHSVLAEFERMSRKGKLFQGSGVMSGHLNCFPGRAARAVYDALERQGIIDLASTLAAFPLTLPNVGCNLNLPGSFAQHEHIDGDANRPFLVVNVAMVDTTLNNGALEIFPRTQDKSRRYWEFLASRPERLRHAMAQGDVLIRTSSLWYREMPNRAQDPRPMLAFSWEDGGSKLADPFEAHKGQLAFLPNRFRTDWSGRLRERLSITAPHVDTALRIAASLMPNTT